MEKEYVVPDGMMGAATTATVDNLHVQISPHVQRCALVAALSWLAQNPIEPSNEQCAAMLEEFNNPHSKQPEIDRFIATEWQRRMFLKPAPTYQPERLQEFVDWLKSQGCMPAVIENLVRAWREAYELGKAAK